MLVIVVLFATAIQHHGVVDARTFLPGSSRPLFFHKRRNNKVQPLSSLNGVPFVGTFPQQTAFGNGITDQSSAHSFHGLSTRGGHTSSTDELPQVVEDEESVAVENTITSSSATAPAATPSTATAVEESPSNATEESPSTVMIQPGGGIQQQQLDSNVTAIKEATREAKLEAKEATKEAKIEAKEAAKEAKIEAKEAKREAKIEAKEQKKKEKEEKKRHKQIAKKLRVCCG